MFISKEGVPISDDEGNTVWIWEKMPMKPKNKVLSAFARLSVLAAQSGNFEIDIGEYQTALLVNNILRWSGPMFQGYEVSEENIGLMDPDEPLFEKVLEEVARRNPLEKKSLQATLNGAGSVPSEAKPSKRANGTSTLRARNATTGPRP